MAYADQRMSSRRVVAIAIVALLHAVIGYAFITGLAYSVVKKAVADLKTFDVEEAPPPPEEKPPPPPPEQKVEPPPMVAPPPIVQAPTVVAPPTIATVATPPAAPVITPTAPPAPPPPPPPAAPPVQLTPRGNFQSLMTTDDYPSRALRAGEEGTTAYRLTVGPDGRVTNCTITGSSGSSELDDTACRLLSRRARFNPGKDSSGSAMGGEYNGRFRWQIPKE
jgi:protein TonB